jgi:hypothetical protein
VIKGGEPGKAGRTWAYWGKFTGSESGSYRATCVWLGDMSWDNRLMCTVLLSFRARPGGVNEPNGGGLVAQGLVSRPHKPDAVYKPDGLFKHPSKRQLAIMGGTGPYKGMWGYASLRGAPGNISIQLIGE